MNRRQILVSGGSVLALALAPSVAMVAPVATFVPPTTNIVHLAGRIGQKCLFTDDDLLRMLGLDPSKIKAVESEKEKWLYDEYGQTYYDRMDEARSLAEKGSHDIYERARLVIDIRRKMNLHFNFVHSDQVYWLDQPNPLLKGTTFRKVMEADLRFAAEIIDSALKGQYGVG